MADCEGGTVEAAVIVTVPPLGIADGAVNPTTCPLAIDAVVEPENVPQLGGLLQLTDRSAAPEARGPVSVTAKLAVPPIGRVAAVGVRLMKVGRSVTVQVAEMVGSL